MGPMSVQPPAPRPLDTSFKTMRDVLTWPHFAHRMSSYEDYDLDQTDAIIGELDRAIERVHDCDGGGLRHQRDLDTLVGERVAASAAKGYKIATGRVKEEGTLEERRMEGQVQKDLARGFMPPPKRSSWELKVEILEKHGIDIDKFIEQVYIREQEGENQI